MGLTVQEHRTMVQRWIGDDSRRLPMFRDAEIMILVPQLVEALRLARENERVTYYLSQPQTSVKRTITSGGCISGVPNCILFWGIGRRCMAFRLTG